MAKSPFDDLIATTARSLKTLGDELREKANAAGKDAQEAWQKAKPQLEEVEARMRDGVETLKQKAQDDGWREQVEVAAVEAKERWKEVEPRMKPIIDGIGAAGAAFGKAVDEAIAGRKAAGAGADAADEGAAADDAADFGDDDTDPNAELPADVEAAGDGEAAERVKARAAANQERIRDELNKAGKSLEGAAVAALDEMQGAIGRLRDKLGNK